MTNTTEATVGLAGPPTGQYLTLPQAAKALGIPVFTLRRAENAGLIKSYQPFSARKRVILHEVREAIATYRGGRNNG